MPGILYTRLISTIKPSSTIYCLRSFRGANTTTPRNTSNRYRRLRGSMTWGCRIRETPPNANQTKKRSSTYLHSRGSSHTWSTKRMQVFREHWENWIFCKILSLMTKDRWGSWFRKFSLPSMWIAPHRNIKALSSPSRRRSRLSRLSSHSLKLKLKLILNLISWGSSPRQANYRIWLNLRQPVFWINPLAPTRSSRPKDT